MIFGCLNETSTVTQLAENYIFETSANIPYLSTFKNDINFTEDPGHEPRPYFRTFAVSFIHN